MWYFPLLRPYNITAASPDPLGDHIPVATDLSDLANVIQWCKTHDRECETIADNSKALYNRLIAYEGQLDYMQLVLHEIAARFRPSASLSIYRGLPLKVPALGLRPGASADWFGADHRWYVDCKIGLSEAPLPSLPEHSTTACTCPRCEEKRKAKTVAAAVPYQHVGGSVGRGVGAIVELARVSAAPAPAPKVRDVSKALALAKQRAAAAAGKAP
jgi:hypothetical protein